MQPKKGSGHKQRVCIRRCGARAGWQHHHAATGVAGRVFRLGVRISEDAGGSFHRANGVDLADVADMRGFRNRAMRFAFNPARPEEMYAALELRGFIRDADGGDYWQEVPLPAGCNAVMSLALN